LRTFLLIGLLLLPGRLLAQNPSDETALVEDDEPGPEVEGAGDGHELALRDPEGLDAALGRHLRADEGQGAPCLLAQDRAVHHAERPHSRRETAEADVLGDAEAAHELRLLVEVVARACKRISIGVNKGALGDVMGSADSENVQGEIQKKLDIIANEVLLFGSPIQIQIIIKGAVIVIAAALYAR